MVTEERQSSTVLMHDCEDDGETGAGAKLLQLLHMLDASGVIIVVSRWYGGIHLGADRFRHISNCARQLLVEHGFGADKLSQKKR
jgi:putative IMPACT (imprinted ancient) family translation regulator